MSNLRRRTFLKVLGAATAGATVGAPLWHAMAEPGATSDEFFILIHAAGGWDVTLWSDPRFKVEGIVDPATDSVLDIAGLTHWKEGAAVEDGGVSFSPITAGKLLLGPAIGDLLSHADKMTLLNGVAMNTVSHPDGTYYSSTGRHLAGGRPVSTSLNTLLANEFGPGQLLPNVSINFPSTFLDGNLDLRVLPLRVSTIATVGKSLSRATAFDTAQGRDAVTVMLTDEARDLAKIAHDPIPYEGMAIQLEALRDLLSTGQKDLFDTNKLKAAQPTFNHSATYQASTATSAAFAIEAFKKNVARSVAFSTSSFDTHNSNYRFHGKMLQEFFDLLARMVEVLEATPHPTKPAAKLADHTHILVVSEFCRTPQINIQGGRDHYPNNSALILSPRFKGGTVFGKSDPGQLLPLDAKTFSDGKRPVAPPDILATMLGAFGVNPRKYLRDGEVIPELLKG